MAYKVTGEVYESAVEGRQDFRRAFREQRTRANALEAALRFGAGCAINELVSRRLPPEWSPESGIGKMLAALGCNSTQLDQSVRDAVAPEVIAWAGAPLPKYTPESRFPA